MHRYILKRILMLIPVIVGASFLVYLIMDLAPGTIIDVIAPKGATAEEIQALEKEYMLDKSVIVRYFHYMLNLVQGDLGMSLMYERPVTDMFFERFPLTLKLAVSATVISVIVAVPLGILAAKHRGSVIDTGCTVFAMMGLSMPGFWLGLLLMILFSLKLHLLPSSGYEDGIKSLILPAFSNSLILISYLMRQTRSSMLENMRQDFLLTARAKGVKEKKVINKHALRNALIPMITTVGNNLGIGLTGAVTIEAVFSLPGVGRMLVDAVNNRDATLATGSVIILTVVISIMLLLVDILYAAVDPRIKARYARGGMRSK